jgi:hypothetical protein
MEFFVQSVEDNYESSQTFRVKDKSDFTQFL